MSLVIYCQWCRKKLTEPGALLFSPPDRRSQCVKAHACKECYKKHLNPPKMITRIFKPHHDLSKENGIEYAHSRISSHCIAQCTYGMADRFLSRLLDKFDGAYRVKLIADIWKENMRA